MNSEFTGKQQHNAQHTPTLTLTHSSQTSLMRNKDNFRSLVSDNIRRQLINQQFVQT